MCWSRKTALSASALAAARALMERSDMDAEKIARKALDIAAGICVFTNTNVTLEAIDL
jgi:ATP-dependent HslUV protease subunit HslV